MNEVAVLGMGWISSKIYIPYFSQRQDITKIHVFEPDTNVLLTENLYIADSILDIALNNNISMVIIASPNNVHFQQMQLLIEHGKTVICEKPFCTSLADVQLFKKLYQNCNNIYFSTPFRFREEILFLKNRFATIKNIYKINARWLRKTGIPTNNWRLDSCLAGGGVLIDLGPHMLDILFWLLGTLKFDFYKSFSSNRNMQNSNNFSTWYNSNPESIVSSSNIEDTIDIYFNTNETICNVELAWSSAIDGDIVEFEFLTENEYIKLSTIFGFSCDTNILNANVSCFTSNGNIKNEFDITSRTDCYYKMLDSYTEAIFDARYRGGMNTSASVAAMELICKLYSAQARNTDNVF